MRHAQVPLDRSTYVISTAAHFTGLLLNSLLLGIVVAKGKISANDECLCQRFQLACQQPFADLTDYTDTCSKPAHSQDGLQQCYRGQDSQPYPAAHGESGECSRQHTVQP